MTLYDDYCGFLAPAGGVTAAPKSWKQRVQLAHRQTATNCRAAVNESGCAVDDIRRGRDLRPQSAC